MRCTSFHSGPNSASDLFLSTAVTFKAQAKVAHNNRSGIKKPDSGIEIRLDLNSIRFLLLQLLKAEHIHYAPHYYREHRQLFIRILFIHCRSP